MHWLALLGLLMTIGAHVGHAAATRRARRRYRAMLGDVEPPDSRHDRLWHDVRPLAGAWGCLAIVLEFLRGLGLVIAVGATVLALTER
jgi:hypothetical protein